MGKGTGTTRGVSETSLPAWQLPYAQHAVGEAKNLYDRSGPNFFPGNTVAGLTGDEINASNYLKGVASTSMPEIAEWSQASFAKLLQNASDPMNDPNLQKSVDAAIRPVFQNLTESVLPNIRGGFLSSGGIGNSRRGIEEGRAVDATTRNALDITSNMYSDAYQRSQQNLGQALTLGPSLQGLYATPGQVLGGVGAQQRAIDQAKIDEEVARYTYGENLPYTKLSEYSNLIRSPFGAVGTSTAEGPPVDSTSQIVGGAAVLIPLLTQLFSRLFK